MHQRQCQGPFQIACDLILASGSPRRRELLSALGLKFSVKPGTAEEPAPVAGEPPDVYALHNAGIKAEDVAGANPGALTLGADTIVVAENVILGKPHEAEDALMMLSRLTGKAHEVITACSLIWPERDVRLDFTVGTKVWFGNYSMDVLKAYVATGEPLDKAGAYAIQGIGAFMVERIDGSYSNVVGLPVCELVHTLDKLGVLKATAD